eukprot:CCRYP_011648-RA/>CCRYP_011648-RA protein AED:0.06 eAED:0.06 QI:253/1/1/1/0.75/0.6/5/458/777
MFRRYGANDNDDGNDGGDSRLDVAECDHYDYSNASTPLNRSTKRKGGSSSVGGPSKWLVLPLVLLTAASLLYGYRLQNQLSSLSNDVRTLQRNASLLQSSLADQATLLADVNATLASHSKVIARFQNSISNADVLQKLHTLETQWNDTQARVEADMVNTKTEIRQVLESTKSSIDESVTAAQNEIHGQVALVQANLATYIRTTQDQFSTENSFMVYQLAGTFTLLGCLISMWHMTSHLRSFHQPFVQRKILAILWMCPIYSVTSWMSLVVPSIEGYLAILKDLYEAYVIYQFLSFLIAVLGKGNRDAVVDLLATHASHLSPPVRCFGWCRKELQYTMTGEEATTDKNRQLADDVLLQCQLFAMQFVFLRPLLTATLFALKKIDYHGPMFGPGSPFDHHDQDPLVDGEAEMAVGGGLMDYRSPQFYLVILENVSVFMAFSGLLKFYHAVQEDLSWCRPFPKFLCIKGVVFMTFWQGVIISLLADTTDLLSSSEGNEDQQEIMAKQTQNFLICLEMLGFSIAHFYCFPVEEWEEGYRPVQDKSKFGDNLALGDFLHDLKLILRHNKTKRKRKDKFSSEDSISTVLEEDEELGDSESLDNGLDSLLEDVEGLLESRERDERVTSSRHQHSPGSSSVAAGSLPPSGSGIFRSLKEMNAPKELCDATALLLQSSLLDETTARLLTRDIMDLSAYDEHICSNDNNHDSEANILDQSTKETPSDNTHEESVEWNTQLDDSHGEASSGHGDGAPNETSALLSTSIQNEEMLKPSIFTMHSLPPME